MALNRSLFQSLADRVRSGESRWPYTLNHYRKRYVQTFQFYREDLRWRFRRTQESGIGDRDIRVRLGRRGVRMQSRTKGCLSILYVGYGDKAEAQTGFGNVVDRYAAGNLLPALRSFGRVTEFAVEYPQGGFSGSWSRRRQDVNRELLALVEDMPVKPDVLIGQMSGWFIDRRTIEQIRAANVLVMNYSWDDTAGFYGGKSNGVWIGPAELAAAVDVTLTSAKRSCLKYQAEGGLAFFWPEAANPEIHRPYDVPFDYDVTFVGGRYGYRPLLVDFLRKRGIQVVAFGPGWEGGMLPPEEMIRLYSRSRINLGFGGIGHMLKVMHLKGRDFEIPMSGGLYLTSHNPELEECYEIGKEIVCYKDRRDCSAKIRDLLDHPDEAEAIRKAGHQRALRDHTWSKRLEQAFRFAGLLD